MTIQSEMKDRALAEFDRMMAGKEREIRSRMSAGGSSQVEIEAYLKTASGSLMSDVPAGLALLEALQATFPCEEAE